MKVAPGIILGGVCVPRVIQVVGDSPTDLPAAQAQVADRVHRIAAEAICMVAIVDARPVPTNAASCLLRAVKPTGAGRLKLAINIHVHALPVALSREHKVVPHKIVCVGESVGLHRCRYALATRVGSPRSIAVPRILCAKMNGKCEAGLLSVCARGESLKRACQRSWARATDCAQAFDLPWHRIVLCRVDPPLPACVRMEGKREGETRMHTQSS